MKQRSDGRWVKKKTINGKAVFFYSSEKTEKKALSDIESQMIRYKEEEEKGKSFSKIADDWDSQYREKNSDINYRKNVKAAYSRIIDYFSCYDDINKVTAMEINKFINSLILKNFYKKTIANHKCVLNMIFQYALLNGYINYNPVSDIRLPHNLPQKHREMPTAEEIKVVDSHYTGFDLLPYFLLYTGLRKSEALALSYSDIDFKNKLITVNKRVTYDCNKPIIENVTKTQRSTRTVILLDRLSEKLPHNGKGIIFCNDDKQPLTLRQYNHRWKKYQQDYNVALTAHQLRHAYATMLFEAGIDLKDAQDLMGHSDINLTRQIYTHIRDKRKSETQIKLNEFSF